MNIRVAGSQVRNAVENILDKYVTSTELRIAIGPKTRFRDRIRLNCKILVGSMSLDNVHQRHVAEDFLILVADLNPVDIMLGLRIHEQQKNRPKEFSFDS